MRFVLPIASIIAFAASGCIINGDLYKGTDVGTGGTSGSAGGGGTDGTAGSTGSAGTAGTGGTAGTAGTAGSGGSAGMAGSSGTGGTAGVTAGTSGVGGSGGTGGMAPVPPKVRIANLSSGSDVIRVCTKSAGADASTYVQVDDTAFPVAGLGQGNVSGYASLMAGSIDVGVIAASAGDCASRLAEIENLVLDENSWSTIVYAGSMLDESNPVHARRFLDNPSVSSTAQLRFLLDSPGVPVLDLGEYAGLLAEPPVFDQWTVFFKNVDGTSSIAAATGGGVMVDERGYATLPAPLPAGLPLEHHST